MRSCAARARALPTLLLVLAGAAWAQPGDGVLVDTAAALVRAAAAGGVVTIAPGAYPLPETLVLRGDVELRAVEPGTVRLDLRGAPVGVSVEPGARARLARIGLAYDAAEPGDLLRVRDATLTLDDVDAAFAVAGGDVTPERPFGLGSGLVATGAAEVTVAGGGFGRHGGHAFEARDRASLRLDGVIVVNNGAGILVDGEARLEMGRGEVRSHAGSALEVRGQARASLVSVLVEDGGSVAGNIDAVRVRDDAEAEFRDVVFAYHPGIALAVSDRGAARLIGATFSSNGRDLQVGDAAIAELAEVRIVGPTAEPARD